jgi:cytochrome P450
MTTTVENPDTLIREALFTPAGRRDPYPILSRLHHHGEAARVSLGYTAVWGYEAVTGVLRTPGLWKTHPDYELSTPHLKLTPDEVTALKEASGNLPPWLVFSNPPYHTRARRLVSKAFTPRRMEQMRERVEEEVTRLLDAIDPTRPVDIVDAVTAPLPQHVIGEIIGLTPENSESFVRHAREQGLLKDPNSTFEDKIARMRDRARWADEIRDLIAARRASAQDDVITALIEATHDGDELTEPEMISLIMLLFAAGFDTSNNMLANGIYALLRHPDQMAELVDDPSLGRLVTEEVLRYDSPAFDTFYYAVGEQRIGDLVVPDGEPLELYLGIANHDPRIFSDPGRFRIKRSDPAPVSFGAGAHLCLGISLARLEGEALFSQLAKRFPDMRLAENDPPRILDIAFRGFESMQVLLHP